MTLIISPKIREKLNNKQPPVTKGEIEQCFANRNGKFLTDTRAENRTNPPTQWFVSETDYGRRLKICFMLSLDGDVHIKTAYDPNAEGNGVYTQNMEKIMETDKRIPDTVDAWEDGTLGRDEAYVEVATEEGNEALINDSLGLRPISIRLEKSLIDDFKALGAINGLGYQTLMRQVLKRFADCEKKRILAEVAVDALKRREAEGRERREAA